MSRVRISVRQGPFPDAFLLSDHLNFTEAEEPAGRLPAVFRGAELPACRSYDNGAAQRTGQEKKPMDVTEQVDTILAYGDCCDHCLGRFFGKRSHGLSNDERGRGLRIAIAIEENQPYKKFSSTCWVCGNFFDTVPLWADRVVDAVKGLEFSTFLVGCRVPPLIAENEEMVWSDLSLAEPEPFKSEVNREVGKAVSARTGKVVDFKKPEVVIILDPSTGTTEVLVNSVFFYGRYQKFERGIPQTHWDCRACRGAGLREVQFHRCPVSRFRGGADRQAGHCRF